MKQLTMPRDVYRPPLGPDNFHISTSYVKDPVRVFISRIDPQSRWTLNAALLPFSVGSSQRFHCNFSNCFFLCFSWRLLLFLMASCNFCESHQEENRAAVLYIIFFPGMSRKVVLVDKYGERDFCYQTVIR